MIEYNLYRQIFYIIYGSLPKPDIYVYLHLTTENCWAILKSGVVYEKTITEEYLQKIQDSYFRFFRQNRENRYLVIDVNRIDFVEHEKHYNMIMDAIFNHDYPVGINTLIL